MQNHWVLRVTGAILLLIGLVAVGFIAYNAGVAQGQTIAPAAQAAAPAAQIIAPWHVGAEWHPLAGLIFLPFLLCLVPLFLGLFVFMPLRLLFGPHHMGWRMHGRWHGEEGSVPPPVEEWHRRMHEKTDKQG